MTDLFFDARYIRVGQHDGISRFSAGLFSALSKQTQVTAIISDLRQLDKLPTGTQFVKINDPTSFAEPFAALKLNRLGATTVFSPMQTIGSFGRKFKLVLTVHDLIYYRHPAPPPGFNVFVRALWRLYHLVYWPQRFLLNRADAIATVSETTKSLITKHRLTKKPVYVVYNAAGEDDHFKSPDAMPTENSLVYMGSFMDYKNVETLIKAMKWLPGFQLNLLSRISDERRSALEQLIPADCKVNFLNGVSEDEYHNQLSRATALVSASRDEGFGIPLVEAMSRGIPIVVSDIQIFKEIGGDAAIFCDPNSPMAFASAVQRLTKDINWKTASELSQIQAAKFSWNKSAQALMKVLESIS
jgi:glycosyltransferase involved in cell wall biosynthesis